MLLFSRSPAIAHLDMDAFYASVEQRDFPELRGRPVVVGSSDPSRRGVVAAASYEARALGIRSAMPLRRAWKLCPDACFMDLRMEAYVEESRQVMSILREYSPRVEPLSLDEAFFDLSGTLLLFGPPEQTIRHIQKRVLKETGLNSSVGIAPVKFVSKIASDLHKPAGIVVVPPGTVEAFLHPLAVSRLWGVGPRTLESLQRMGVETIGDLAGMGLERLEQSFGKWGTHLWRLSRGVDERPVEPLQEEKSVGHEITFPEDRGSQEAIERTLLALAEKVARRLRKQGVAGRTVTLKFRTASFRSMTRSMSSSEYIDQAWALYEIAKKLLTRVDRRGEKARLLGISVSSLLAREEVPRSLFEEPGSRHSERVSDAMDELGRRFGVDSVRRARLLRRKES
ncbi:MAG: DNA polymerase IV [Candidatus Krumholzibacteria bacterium]|nr:DNA polymerase IV [Candidatus Krumholzibacteria bacterium]MDP6669907.1 DNA polymerase IV [Candidatus Krumholzibacteria bacterium]MDP6797936.1 DNA polymerase IV [Candidatus Krumholzibacteria bacterium]MDP7021106.1 DNA polymerase IV [Candidatus Krumholzibacteria bacterium]